MFKMNKTERGKGVQADPLYYQPRASTTVRSVRPVNGAKPLPVDTMPVLIDNGNPPDSFVYREGRAPAHQYSRATTPLHFNASYGSEFRDTGFVAGAKVESTGTVAVPRNRNPGMQPNQPRANQYRPEATSYGSQSIMQSGTQRVPVGAMRKWFA